MYDSRSSICLCRLKQKGLIFRLSIDRAGAKSGGDTFNFVYQSTF